MLFYICEDSESDAMRLNHHLNTFSQEYSLPYQSVTFSSGKELIDAYEQSAVKPDLVFLDIYMDGTDGIESARALRRMGYTGGIIFTTSSTEHAMDSYEVNALYYLQKPYDHNHFMNAMQRCGNLFQKPPQNFVYTIRKRQYSVPYTDIVYFETGRHTVILHTTEGTVSFADNLSRIVGLFHSTDDFLPIGRSYLVNLYHVTGQADNDLLMSDGSIVQIPLKKQREILSAIEQWRKSISR